MQLTVTQVSTDERYIELDLEFDGEIYPLELVCDHVGIYWLSIYGEYVEDFSSLSFTILNYHNRTLIQWICDKVFELSEIAKDIENKEKNIDYLCI